MFIRFVGICILVESPILLVHEQLDTVYFGTLLGCPNQYQAFLVIDLHDVGSKLPLPLFQIFILKRKGLQCKSRSYMVFILREILVVKERIESANFLHDNHDVAIRINKAWLDGVRNEDLLSFILYDSHEFR